MERKRMETTRIVNILNDDYDIYIGRGIDPKTKQPSKWGNPFSHKTTPLAQKVASRKDSLIQYRNWITTGEGKALLNDLHELKGKTLGCFCKPKSCHGDILIELIKQHTSGVSIEEFINL